MHAVVKHVETYLDINETFASKFLRDFYMDDSITGTQDVNDGFEFYLFVKTLILEGGFEIGKCHSNSPELLERIRDYEKRYFKIIEENGVNKVLGITWYSEEDTLAFPSIYDPSGVMSLAVVTLNSLFQDVCTAN